MVTIQYSMFFLMMLRQSTGTFQTSTTNFTSVFTVLHFLFLYTMLLCLNTPLVFCFGVLALTSRCILTRGRLSSSSSSGEVREGTGGSRCRGSSVLLDCDLILEAEGPVLKGTGFSVFGTGMSRVSSLYWYFTPVLALRGFLPVLSFFMAEAGSGCSDLQQVILKHPLVDRPAKWIRVWSLTHNKV